MAAAMAAATADRIGKRRKVRLLRGMQRHFAVAGESPATALSRCRRVDGEPLSMRRLILLPVVAALVAGSGVALGQTAHPSAAGSSGLRAGVGVADATWHVGAGAGQYASESFPSDPTDPESFLSYRPDISAEWDPNVQHVKDNSSYGVASRLSIRAIVLQDGHNHAPVALVKDDNYLAQDMLTRRVAQLLQADGSKVSYENILVSATHDHNSPYYSSPAAGVWLFQDVMDL